MSYSYLKSTQEALSGDPQSDAVLCLWQWLRERKHLYVYVFYFATANPQRCTVVHLPQEEKITRRRKKNHSKISNSVASQLFIRAWGMLVCSEWLSPQRRWILVVGQQPCKSFAFGTQGQEQTLVNHQLSIDLSFSSFFSPLSFKYETSKTNLEYFPCLVNSIRVWMIWKETNISYHEDTVS